MKIEFESENKAFLASLQEIADKVTPAAQVSALNSAAAKIARESVKIASSTTGVSAKTLRKRIKVPKSKKATARFPNVTIFGGLWPVPVAKLTPKPRKLKRGGVKYKTMPGQAQNPNAFIAPHKGGGDGVFVRKGHSRLPIKKVSVDIAPHVRRAIAVYLYGSAAQAHYEKILFSQMDRRVRSALRRKGLDVS